MLDWWVSQPPFIRTTVALIPLGIGVVFLFLGAWRAGLILTALGVALFVFSFPSRAEQKGFHDF